MCADWENLGTTLGNRPWARVSATESDHLALG
jgi:hypothetical protein